MKNSLEYPPLLLPLGQSSPGPVRQVESPCSQPRPMRAPDPPPDMLCHHIPMPDPLSKQSASRPSSDVGTKLVVVPSFVVVVVATLGSLLPDGNLDTLCGEAFAERCALTHAWEFLRRVHLEHVAKHRGQHRRLAVDDRRLSVDHGRSDVDKRESEAGRASAQWSGNKGVGGYIPEVALGPHAEVLQDEPDAILVLRIDETEGGGRETADKVPGEHSLRLATADRQPLRQGELRVGVVAPGLVIRRPLRRQRHSLHIGAELVGVVLVWWRISAAVRANIATCFPVSRDRDAGVAPHTLVALRLHGIGVHRRIRRLVHLGRVADLAVRRQDVGVGGRGLLDGRVRRRRGGRDGRRRRGMADEVHLLEGIFGPEIDVEHIHGVFDLAVQGMVSSVAHTQRGQAQPTCSSPPCLSSCLLP